MSDYSTVFKAPPTGDLDAHVGTLKTLTEGFDPIIEREKWMAIGATLSLVKVMLPNQNAFGDWVSASAVDELPGLKSAAARSDAIWCSENEARVDLIPLDVAAHPRRIRSAWRSLLKHTAKEQLEIFEGSDDPVSAAVVPVMNLTHADKAEATTALQAAAKPAPEKKPPKPEEDLFPEDAFHDACKVAWAAGCEVEVAVERVVKVWNAKLKVDAIYTQADLDAEVQSAVAAAEPPPVSPAAAQDVLRATLGSMGGDDVQGIVRHLAHQQETPTVANMLVGLLKYMKADECPKSIALHAIETVFGKDA